MSRRRRQAERRARGWSSLARRGTYRMDQATITIDGIEVGGWAVSIDPTWPASDRSAASVGTRAQAEAMIVDDVTVNVPLSPEARDAVVRWFESFSGPSGVSRWTRELARDAEAIAEGRVGLLAGHLDRVGVNVWDRSVALTLAFLRRDLIALGPLSGDADALLRRAWRALGPPEADFEVVAGEVRQLLDDNLASYA